MTTVNVHEAKTRLSQLLAEAEAGGEVIIARNGKPVARLVALEAPRPLRQPGALKGLIGPCDEILDPMTEEELAEWE